LKKDIEAFIVRVWQEAENIKDGRNVWRGSIVHVGSNRQLYFFDLNSIARFIRENTEDQAQESPGASLRPQGNFKYTFLNWIYERIYQFGTRIRH
jgi:hypothetical protein